MSERIQRILEAGGIGAEYQPLLDVRTLQVQAYEALVRLSVDGGMIPNDELFRLLHEDHESFFQIETRFKEFQLQHRPAQYPLFVNLDPDVCHTPGQLAYWTSVLSSAPDITVEIIETTGISDLDTIDALAAAMSAHRVGVALDDLGGPRSLVSVELLARADVLKLDRAWIQRARQSGPYRRLLDGFIGFAHDAGVRAVLEGVETEADLAFARSLGVQLVQGFLFRELFLQAYPARG